VYSRSMYMSVYKHAKHVCLVICLVFVLGGSVGCASSPMVVPENLQNQIDHTLTFSQLLQDPEAHKGKTVVLGGKVLSAKRLTGGTQLEVLQLPLDPSQRPIVARTDSLGRFLAVETDFLDPAIFPADIPVTLVAKVTGMTTAKLDDETYDYPTVAIQHLHVWEAPSLAEGRDPGPWYSIFGGGSSGGFYGGGVGIGIGF
jgi:outer membrane lipoprotein